MGLGVQSPPHPRSPGVAPVIFVPQGDAAWAWSAEYGDADYPHGLILGCMGEFRDSPNAFCSLHRPQDICQCKQLLRDDFGLKVAMQPVGYCGGGGPGLHPGNRGAEINCRSSKNHKLLFVARKSKLPGRNSMCQGPGIPGG